MNEFVWKIKYGLGVSLPLKVNDVIGLFAAIKSEHNLGMTITQTKYGLKRRILPISGFIRRIFSPGCMGEYINGEPCR